MLKLDSNENIKVIHIIKDGQIVFKYMREDIGETQLFPVGCIFKSFLSALFGISIYEGKIGSIEDCVTRLYSEDYYEKSICEYSLSGHPECVPYGLSWWIDVYSDIPCFYASGFGGQYLIVIPQKNITISILSDMDRPHPENKNIIELAF